MATTILWSLCLFGLTANGVHCQQTKTDTTQNNKDRFLVKQLDTTVDSILVVKHFRHLYVFHQQKLLKVYRVSLGGNPVGHKHFEGDLRTPEGLYHITRKNPHSAAYKSLGISYPNKADIAYARKAGKSPGCDVMIHGLWNGFPDDGTDYSKQDWTWGCIAVNNKEMDELYQYVSVGCPVNILP